MTDTSYMVMDYPEPPTVPDDPDCPGCGGPLGSEVYELDGDFVCESCFLRVVDEQINAQDMADALSVRHMATADYLQELREAMHG